MNRAALDAAMRLAAALPSRVHHAPQRAAQTAPEAAYPARRQRHRAQPPGERKVDGRAQVRMVDGVLAKRCAGCKVDHALDAYSAGSGPGGLHRYCRSFRKALRAQGRAW